MERLETERKNRVSFPSFCTRCDFVPFSLPPSLSLPLRVCACVCMEGCGSHVFPYKEWVWKELMRNEQNHSTVTPLFLLFFLFNPSKICLHASLSVCNDFMLNKCDGCSVSSVLSSRFFKPTAEPDVAPQSDWLGSTFLPPLFAHFYNSFSHFISSSFFIHTCFLF